MREGIAAFRKRDIYLARSYLSYAADVLILAGIVPDGSSLARPNELFLPIVVDLSAEDRTFDFDAVFKPSFVPRETIRDVQRLSDRSYVELQCMLLSVEFGQSREVPPEFTDRVWRLVDSTAGSPAAFQQVLDRSRDLHGRIRDLLREAGLPEAFCYVAWVESGLLPTRQDPGGPAGLWQLMPATARQYGLRVEPASGVDERLDVTMSTRAAGRYIAGLVNRFGREQFLLALASYNQGESAVLGAMGQLPDPMMESGKKFWYLVQNRLIPQETRDLVLRIFATKILAEAPERFGLRR